MISDPTNLGVCDVLFSLGVPFDLKLYMYVLVNRCLTHRVSPLVRSLLMDRSLGPLTGALTRGTFVLLRTFSRYGYQSVSFLAADR